MSVLIIAELEYKVIAFVVCALIMYITVRRIVKTRKGKQKRNAYKDVPK